MLRRRVYRVGVRVCEVPCGGRRRRVGAVRLSSASRSGSDLWIGAGELMVVFCAPGSVDPVRPHCSWISGSSEVWLVFLAGGAMEVVTRPERNKGLSAHLPLCVGVLRDLAAVRATAGGHGPVVPLVCVVSVRGRCAGGGGHAVELLFPGSSSATAWIAPTSPWNLGILLCRWGGTKSSSPSPGGVSIWCFFGSELLPTQGRRSEGGRFGDSGRSSAPGAGSRLRASRPRFVHRLRSRRSTAGGSCSSKAWRCSPFLDCWWPALRSSPGVAGDREWRRASRKISFFAVVWVALFRLCRPVFVICCVFVLC